MALTEAEKERVRYHLGYLGVQPAATLGFGVPFARPTQFMLESNLTKIMLVSEPRVRRLLTILDKAECLLEQAMEQLGLEAIDGIKFDNTQPDKLEKEYDRWANRLADIMGVPFYAYSKRFQQSGNATGMIPVV